MIRGTTGRLPTTGVTAAEVYLPMETETHLSPGKAPAAISACPRCAKPLTDPTGLGWCPACGYCHSLEEDRAKLNLKPAPKAKQAPVVVPGMAPAQFPVWACVLIAGMIVLAVVTLLASRQFPLKPLHRAIWTTVQLGSGVLIMFVAQCYALYRIAPEDGALHFTDALVPFRLYSLVFKRLPRMAPALWLGAWGLTLILSAAICVGGLDHWLTYLPRSQAVWQ
jgi:hypothetical protein